MVIYQILIVVSILSSFTLSFYAFIMRKVKNARVLSLLLLFMAVSDIGSLFELIASDIKMKILWRNISHLGYLIVAPTLLVLVIDYVGRGKLGMLLRISFPLAIEILKILRNDLNQILPPTSVTSSITGVLLFVSIFRYQFFSSVPIASEKIVDSISDGIITINGTGKIIDKNNVVDRFIMDVTGQNINIKGKRIDPVLAMWPRWAISCIKMLEDEFEIDSSALGKKRYYYVKINPIYGKKDKLGTVSIIMDITERKNREFELLTTAEGRKEQLKDLEEELHLQKKQLETIIDNMSDSCVVVDKTGKNIKISKAANEFILSLQFEQVDDWIKGARCYDLNGDMINSDMVPARRVINGEKLVNYRLTAKKNEEEVHYNINGAPVYDENGEFLFGVICCTDITELIQNEKEIILLNKQLNTIINNISELAILSISDKEGNLLKYSSSVKNYFSMNKSNAKVLGAYQKGVYFNSDGSEIDLYDMPAFRVLRGETIKNLHLFMKKYENETHFLFSGAPIMDGEGNLMNGVFFNIDITEQVMYKKLIPVAEELAALNELKDKLFTIVSHDIRSPIANMVSLFEILEEDDKLYNDENREIFVAIKAQINNTYKIVDNLLDWLISQKEGLVFEPLIWDLSIIAQEVMNMHDLNAKAKNINITSDIVVGMKIEVDKNMLEIVLRNLLSNAIKFTGDGGKITIQAFESGNEIIIAIHDTGTGMDNLRVSTLFNEAYAYSTVGTAGEKGIGIGLLICKEFVVRNGGIIWAESIPGVGSTFYFSLPIVKNSIE